MNGKRVITLLLAALWQVPALAADTAAAASPAATGGAAEEILQVISALVLVLLLIVGMAWLMRRVSGFGATGGAVRILGGVSVGQRERVVLLQVGEQQLLVGVAPGQVRTLYALPQPIRMEEEKVEGESFAERLHAALKRGGRT